MRARMRMSELGFAAITSAGNRQGEVTVLGFSGIPNDAAAVPAVTYSTTEYADLPPEAQRVHLVGKGVGMRLYNTPQALEGLANPPERIGAYTVTLNTHPGRLLDTRQASDGTLGGKSHRVARHLGRMVYSHAEDLAVLTHAIHKAYGSADAVLISQPPLPRLRELVRGARPPVPSAFLIIRNPHVPLFGAGEYDPDYAGEDRGGKSPTA